MQLTTERIFVVAYYLRTRSSKGFNNSLINAFGIDIRQIKWSFGRGLSLNLNKDHSGRRRTERTQENINLLQDKLIKDLRISARKNGLDIKSTLNRITKRVLKCHLYKVHVRKESKINEVDILKENQDFIERVMAGMRRRMQVCLQKNGGHIEGNGN